jgi:hypothetical protein
MYSTTGGLVLAFHGNDLKNIDEALQSPTRKLRDSDNAYDWLGGGLYFWENDPRRAMEWAVERRDNPPKRSSHPIETPAVIGAVLDLGYCFDLLRRESIAMLKDFYDHLTATVGAETLPHNKKLRGSNEALLRDLDCFIINEYHRFRKSKELRAFDSVRGAFWEGDDLYPEAGFKEKSHIQICVRNPNCIKGFFMPREQDTAYPSV